MSTPLSKHPIHLGLGATAVSEPEFTGIDWYPGYTARHATDGNEGRLVSLSSFSSSWDVWEMHPVGSEVVICMEGELTLVQELEGEEQRTTLSQGQYAINPPGVWHTADVSKAATALFITSGLGTQHRARQ
jgi:hypothetical protein